MSNVIGTFYFRDEGEGCIMGKYFNTGMTTTLVEAAKIKNLETLNKPKRFCGIYSTIWLDDIDDPNQADLEIQPKGDDLYALTWTRKNSHEVMYRGEAMLVGDILVGSYWSPSIHPVGY